MLSAGTGREAGREGGGEQGKAQCFLRPNGSVLFFPSLWQVCAGEAAALFGLEGEVAPLFGPAGEGMATLATASPLFGLAGEGLAALAAAAGFAGLISWDEEVSAAATLRLGQAASLDATAAAETAAEKDTSAPESAAAATSPAGGGSSPSYHFGDLIRQCACYTHLLGAGSVGCTGNLLVEVAHPNI